MFPDLVICVENCILRISQLNKFIIFQNIVLMFFKSKILNSRILKVFLARGHGKHSCKFMIKCGLEELEEI